jgi:BirA family biotin operon repressor/biotin-[acetyl-CoA-carboxylase] ligase
MLDKEKIKSSLKTSFFGEYLYYFSELDSTNNYLKNVAAGGAPEGTIVLTDYQRSGKGRMGREWQSTAGENILMSILLRPKLSIEAVQCITLATSNIVVSAIEKYLKQKKIRHPQFILKWPNDIYVQHRKMAGILIESSLQDKWIDFLVVGIGINVNQNINELDANIRDAATSLQAETDQTFDREQLIATLINTYEKEYIRLESTGYHGVIPDWKKRCTQIGKRILIETPVYKEYGQFKDLNEKGILLYETDEGAVKELVAGTIKAESE